MRQRVRVVSLVVAALLIAAASAVHAQQKIDVTGAWLFNVDTGTPGTPTVTFKQTGDQLTGHYSSATLGEADFKGTLKGQDITFSFAADAGGQAVDVVYKGTVSSNNDMKGTIDVAGGAVTGTFTGKRK